MTFKLICSIVCLIVVSQGMFCNYYPMNSKACIQLTQGLACQYYTNENSCQSTSSTGLGCVSNLNQVACLQQTSGISQAEVHCKNANSILGYFGSRCKPASATILKNVGCSPLLSRYACTNVVGSLCIWKNGCQLYTSSVYSGNSCGTVYNSPVVGGLCSRISQLNCNVCIQIGMNNGLASDYQCVEVPTVSLQTLLCTQLGLSLTACVSITTPGQSCIFLKQSCQMYVPSKTDQCSQNYNRIACLSITNPQAYCNWNNTNNQCVSLPLTQIQNSKCALWTNVNASVCSQVGTICQFNSVNFGCSVPLVSQITCNTPGLNQSTCITLNSPCQYLNQVCSSLTAYQLSILPCSASLNAAACVAITTKYQKCQWNATLLQCQNIQLLKSISCTSLTNVNGNVCKAVVSEGCKYNSSTQSCIVSSTQDVCSTAYLNLQGCTNILSYNVQCQWLNETCTVISVLSYDTKCSSLIYANPNACAAVFETPSLQIGCYYNTATFSCTPIQIPDLTNTLYCNTLGLNALGCASVQVAGQRCRWYQSNCTSLDRPSDIAQIPCLNLTFSNAATCAMATYDSQMCYWDTSAFSCTAAFNYKNEKCQTVAEKSIAGEKGLNSFACGAITSTANQDNCFYDTSTYSCIKYTADDLTTTPVIKQLSTALCSANSPTASLCTAITNPISLCYWNANVSSCQNQYVPINSACSQFSSVNVNVCAAVISQNPTGEFVLPDGSVQSNSAFCNYVPTAGTKLGYCSLFSVNDQSCSSSCCESKIGINAHVCSRFTKQSNYCYFSFGLRCANLANILILTGSASTDNVTIQTYLNANQYTCSQLNVLTCWMLNWSTKQKCYQPSSQGACVQIDYSTLKTLADARGVPQYSILTSGVVVNQFTCQGIQGYSCSGCSNNQYYQYDPNNHVCSNYSGTPTSCTFDSTQLINQNVCTGRTIVDSLSNPIYCIWNSVTLSCSALTIVAPNQTINQQIAAQISRCDTNAVNQNVCLLIQAACSFSLISDSCVTVVTFNVSCDYFTTNKQKVTAQVCLQVTGPQAQCYYDSSNYQCIDYTSMSPRPTITGCDVLGGNAITCYMSSIGNCKWNSITMTCVDLVLGDLQNLKCSSGINYYACLQLTSQPCKWDSDNYQCVYYTASTTASVDVKNFFNALACQSVTSGPCFFDAATSKCSITFPDKGKNTCTFAPMNQLGCTMSTRGYNCQYLNGNCVPLTSLPTTCTGTPLISVDACMNIPQACQFSQTTGLCTAAVVSSTTTCTSMAATTSLPDQPLPPLYNVAACIAVSSAAVNESNNGCKTCGAVVKCGFEKYCQWNPSTYTCLNTQLMITCTAAYNDGEYIGCPATFTPAYKTCSPYFSQAQCFQLTKKDLACVFTSTGCTSITGNAFTIPACSNANGPACIQITNPTLQCQAVTVVGPELKGFNPATNNCIFPYEQTQICQPYVIVDSPTCADLSLIEGLSPSTCIQASDDCSYNSAKDSLKCDVPTATSCSDVTQSPSYCIKNKACVFNTYCQYAKPVTAQDKCDFELAEGDDRLQQFCIATASCSYTAPVVAVDGTVTTPGSCSKVESCTALDFKTLMVSQDVCVSCAVPTTAAYQYDPTSGICAIIIDNVNTCSNLNQLACLKFTTPYCYWTGSICDVFTATKFASYTGTCDKLNTSSCMQVGIPCTIQGNLCTTRTVPAASCSSPTTISNAADCMQISLACKWDTIGSTCISAASYSYCAALGFATCSLNNNQCYWNGSCTETQLNNCTVQLNQVGCLISTSYTTQPGPVVKNSCIYTNKACTVFNIAQNSSPDITMINKHACLQLNQLVYWNNACLSFTINATLTGCAQNYPYSTVPQACATSNTSTKTTYACYQDYKTDVCTQLTTSVTCTASGLNRVGCLTKTDGVSCQFTNKNNACSFYTTIVDGCPDNLNQYACLKQPNAPCIFSNGVCSSFTIDITKASNWQASGSIYQNPWICSQYNYDYADTKKVYLKYSQTQLQCVQYSSGYVKCADPGVNSNTCLLYTYQTCQTTTSGCKLLTSLSDVKCSTTGINIIACTTLSNYSCKFVKDACLDTISTDKCDTLRGTNASPLACSSTTDISCYWSANKCQTLTWQIDCTTSAAVGLNSIACIKYTTKTCMFKVATNTCVYDSNTAINCTDTTYNLNETKCYSITTIGQYCKFNSTAGCTQLIVSASKPYDIQPQNLCNSGIQTNPVSCSLSTGKVCAYNASTHQCTETTPYANCYDLAYNQYHIDMNIDHCVQTTSTSQMCVWVDTISQCRLIADVDGMSLNTLNCASNVNLITCTSIITPGQFCYFSSNKCKLADTAVNCANRLKVNSPYVCAQAVDKNCYYDIATQNCTVPAIVFTDCNIPGLNKSACHSSCLFDTKLNLCYSNDVIKSCKQIILKTKCQQNTTISCMWDGTACVDLPLTYTNCEAAITAILSVAACQSLATLDGISQCKQNPISPNNGCILDTPVNCSDIKTMKVCITFAQSCIWSQNSCKLYANIPETDNCSNLSQIGSQRACLSIIRQGSYCTYNASAIGVANSLTCLDILTPPSNCLPLVNYDACVFSESVNCIWNPTTQICSTFVPTQNQVCGAYTTQSTCIAPTLATPYCQWNDTTKCSNVTPTNNKVCSQYSSQQTCQAPSQVYSICQWDSQASNCTNIPCSPLLSYQACLNLTTIGQFCQWSSNYCQSIDQTKLPAIVTLDTIQIVNANACALINQGMVQYDSNLRKCVAISDISLLTCNTPGLNQLACVSIKAQQCIWNSINKNCQVKQTRLLSTFTCSITGVSQQICRQISGPISCAYLNGNCIQMPATATCSDEGINQYGCVSITSNPCLWLNGQCVDYQPYTLCSLVPSPVNAITCSQVDEDACSYSSEYRSCIAPPINATCSLIGINSIACAQIQGCAYLNSRCQKVTDSLDCAALQIASPQVCALATNRCKYVDVFYGCVPSAITDDCYTPGLSQISCISQFNCVWVDSQCQCQLYNDTFPVCSKVSTYSKCSSLNYCIFIVSQTNSAIDITQQLLAQNFGICRQKLCSDIAVNNPIYDCQGVGIDNTVCYLNQSNKCVAAQQCSDVANSAIDCYLIIFNGNRCQNSQFNIGSCVNLNCLLLNSIQCTQYYDDCYLDGANCIARPCQQKAISQCLQGLCNWNVDKQVCQTQVPCSFLTSQSMCETNYESGTKCAYIVNQSGNNQCVNNGCRYMGLTQSTCSGTHISNTVCVTMSDRSCVACEEIKSSCLCLQQHQCLYNNVHSYCYSNNCQRFAPTVCPSTCRVVSSTNTCEPQCQNQYNPLNCNNAYNCQWNVTQKICQDYVPVVKPVKIILPKLFGSILGIVLLILLI